MPRALHPAKADQWLNSLAKILVKMQQTQQPFMLDFRSPALARRARLKWYAFRDGLKQFAHLYPLEYDAAERTSVSISGSCLTWEIGGVATDEQINELLQNELIARGIPLSQPPHAPDQIDVRTRKQMKHELIEQEINTPKTIYTMTEEELKNLPTRPEAQTPLVHETFDPADEFIRNLWGKPDAGGPKVDPSTTPAYQNPVPDGKDGK